MIVLKGKHIYLRALEPEDLDFIHTIENDETFWEISNTQTPFSRFILKQYLKNSHKDIYEAKQLRLVISNYDDEALGMIDLFDFDFKNSRAGIGILVKESSNRRQGIGKEALQLLIQYSFKHLNLHQLYCNITENNTASLSLFANQGFERAGLKKDWNYIHGSYQNEYFYQLINH
ncbi:MAG: GNAT family N-acetyltransferase [Aquaticitalea sp.]